jgi:hypothetical protein
VPIPVAVRHKLDELPVPIKSMQGHDCFHIDKILNGSISIPVKQLLDVVPIVCRMMASKMKSSLPRCRQAPAAQASAIAITADQNHVMQEPTRQDIREQMKEI